MGCREQQRPDPQQGFEIWGDKQTWMQVRGVRSRLVLWLQEGALCGLCVYRHRHTHTCTHIYTHACTQHTCTQICTRASVHKYMYPTHVCKHIRVCAVRVPDTCVHTFIRTHRVYTYTRMHSHVSNMQTDTHMCCTQTRGARVCTSMVRLLSPQHAVFLGGTRPRS